MVRGNAKEKSQQNRLKKLEKTKAANSTLKQDTKGDWAAAQKARDDKKAAKAAKEAKKAGKKK
jgi:hypothetical protein